MEAFFDRIPRLDSNISAQNAERRWRILNKREWEKEGRKEQVLRVGFSKGWESDEREPDVERYLLIGLQEFSISERIMNDSYDVRFPALSTPPFPPPLHSLSLSLCYNKLCTISNHPCVIFPVRKLKYLWIATKKSLWYLTSSWSHRCAVSSVLLFCSLLSYFPKASRISLTNFCKLQDLLVRSGFV